MVEVQWQDERVVLDESVYEGERWIALNELVSALGAYLKDLPGDATGLCLPDDRCLPLQPMDVRDEETGQQIRLAALASLGLTAGGEPAASRMLLGDPMPDLTFPRLDDGSLVLRDLRGRPSLLFGWASY